MKKQNTAGIKIKLGNIFNRYTYVIRSTKHDTTPKYMEIRFNKNRKKEKCYDLARRGGRG